MDATLIRRFGEAGLELRPALAPIEPSNPEIFQMDIRRLGRAEHFRVWPGRGTEATVLSTDRKLRQLVLLVRQPKRLFRETRVRARVAAPQLRAAARRLGGRLIGCTAETWTVERWTSGTSRYLCGMEERRLFIARLACATAVDGVRQGEWLFVPLADWEAERLEALIVSGRARVLAKEPIGGGPTADELVRLPAPRGWTPGREPGMSIFVRGALRHPERRTLRFRGWMSVVPDGERPIVNAFWTD